MLTTLAGDSDLLTVYNAYCAWKRTRGTPGSNEYAFCRKNFLSPQTLLNIEDVKLQLMVSIADAGLISLDANQKSSLNRSVPTPPPSNSNSKITYLPLLDQETERKTEQRYTNKEIEPAPPANATSSPPRPPMTQTAQTTP